MLGWEPALYSALSCLAAYETTRLMFTGLRRMVCVVSKKQPTVEDAIYRRLRLHSTPIEGSAAQIKGKIKSESDKKEQMVIIYSVHLLDLQRFKAAIQMADPQAEIMYMKRWEA